MKSQRLGTRNTADGEDYFKLNSLRGVLLEPRGIHSSGSHGSVPAVRVRVYHHYWDYYYYIYFFKANFYTTVAGELDLENDAEMNNRWIKGGFV